VSGAVVPANIGLFEGRTALWAGIGFLTLLVLREGEKEAKN
jgi:hypothetical protein